MRFGLQSDSPIEEIWFDYFRVMGFGPDRTVMFCSGCTEGTFRGAGAATCSGCAAGRFSGTDAAACSMCPEGRFQPSESSASCENCPSDTDSAVTSAAGSISLSNCTRDRRIIGYTSFEEPAIMSSTSVPMYSDHDAAADAEEHVLVTNIGQNPVSYSACSSAGSHTELGFRTFWRRNEDSSPEGITAKIGVIGDTSTRMRGDYGQGGSAPDGSQYFMMEDTHDGFLFVKVELVEVIEYSSVQMRAWVLLEGTTWSDDDIIKLWASDVSEQEIVLVQGTNIDSAAGVAVGEVVEDVWKEYTGDVPDDWSAITMQFGLQADSTSKGASPRTQTKHTTLVVLMSLCPDFEFWGTEVWFDYFRVMGFGPDRSALYCNGCDAGSYRSAGAITCSTCGAGQYSAANASACTLCPEGTYMERPGATACTSCLQNPNAEMSSPIGARLPSDCTARARTIGYTSFEEATVTGGTTVQKYFDTLSPTTDHYLVENAGQNPVSHVACSADHSLELGFRTFYTRTDMTSTAGMAGGAKLGVIGDQSTTMRGDSNQGKYAPDGAQYYVMEDTDGFVYVEIDVVSVSDYTQVVAHGWVIAARTSWEDSDLLKMWASDPVSGQEAIMLEETDLDASANLTESTWTEFSVPLTGFADVTVRFGLQSETVSE